MKNKSSRNSKKKVYDIPSYTPEKPPLDFKSDFTWLSVSNSSLLGHYWSQTNCLNNEQLIEA